MRWWLSTLRHLRDQGSRIWLKESDFTVLTTKSDASGHLGWGLVIGDTIHWSKWTPNEALIKDMTFKELVPILYLAETHGHLLRNKIVRVGIDNSAAVFDLLKGDSISPAVRYLLKRLARAQAEFNFDLVGVHCEREKNKLADILTRFVEHEEIAAFLPDGWEVDMDEASVSTSQWTLSPDSRRVFKMALSQPSTTR